MVKIRLMRIGKRNRPLYRLVVMDSRTRRNGKMLDIVGHYDPLRDGVYKVDLQKVDEWIRKGAQVTERAAALIKLARKTQGETQVVSATNPEEGSA